jgi:hypothetical protein
MYTKVCVPQASCGAQKGQSSCPVFCWVHLAQFVVFCIIFWRKLFVLLSFSFGHCIVCSSLSYSFWLILWYLQTFSSNSYSLLLEIISCCFHVIWCLIVSRLYYTYSNLVLCLLNFVCFMVFNTPFNNISVISWRTVLLEETGVPRENHHPVASHWRTLSHNVVSSTHRPERGSNSQLWWWLAPIAQVFVNPTTIRLLLFKSKWQLNWTLFLINSFI